MNNFNFAEVVSHFNFDGEFLRSEEYGCGHINDTFAVYFANKGEKRRYILQRINNKIFVNPDELMQNIHNVTSHIKSKIEKNGGNLLREVLTIISTKDGRLYYKDENANYWRAYIFVEDATSYQTVEKSIHFYNSAKAFGKFQKQLSDFDTSKLFEVIPNFHNTRKRFNDFLVSLKNAPKERADVVRTEIEFAMKRENESSYLVDLLANGVLPLRVTHNDTKLNNIMIDNKSDEGVCVIDLDIVMPGCALYDYGDSIRFGASSSPEDEQDLSKVYMDMSLFEAYTDGFLEEAGDILNDAEIDNMFWGAKLMTFECGIRFLADYLNGNTYFKTHYPEQNIHRCRTQFKLVADMEEKMSKMQAICRRKS